MKKLLLIEDDKDIAELVVYNFQQEKIPLEVCQNGSEGLSRAKKMVPNLVILDLMLPDLSGLEICRTLKADPKTKQIPILMLTAKGTEVDRIVGFEVGADDYLTKPFSPRELILRVKAVLRRHAESPDKREESPITFGLLTLDSQKFKVTVQGREVILTVLEFKLLEYLLSSRGRVATRDRLLDAVWGFEAALTTRTVDTHIKRLRAKLGKAGDYVETIRGIGYRIREKP